MEWAIFDYWISIFGTRLHITVDHGSQFQGDLLVPLNRLVGGREEHVQSTPYRPQANGTVEWMHYILKASLKRMTEIPWLRARPTFLLATSLAEMAFGSLFHIPGDFIAPQGKPVIRLKDFVADLRSLFRPIRPVPASRYQDKHIFAFEDLATC